MLGDLILSVAGLLLDPTTVLGAPTWLKPLKFAISTSLFCFTLAWMIGQLQRTRRFAMILGRFLAVSLILEIILIDLQAGRHTTSHFNFATPFDAFVFLTMGIGIAVVFLSTALLFVATCVERFPAPDSAKAWTLRLGLILALAGMGTGSLMTLPTHEQLAAAQRPNGQVTRLSHVGAHTVGGPDGGPGLPLTGWSADHGDLRIAHFLGLHAMQILLLAFWCAARSRWIPRRQTHLVFAAAASCLVAFAVLLAQALRGQPLLGPDHQTLALWALWLAISFAAFPWKTHVLKPSIDPTLLKETRS
jgi:hypothetical protein